MKKVISILLILMILSTSFASANTNATVRMVMDGRTMDFQTVQLKVDDKAVATDVPSVIHGSRTLVPIHVIRNMGITVEWKDATREVTIKTNDKTVVMKIDSPIATMNGEAIRLPSDVPPKIITYQNSGRTMVPIAFLREIGLIVNWNESTRTVSIEKDEPSEPIVTDPVVTKAVKDVVASFETGAPEIRIKTGEELAYTELKLDGPARLVLDFQDTKFDFTNKGKLQSNGTLQFNVNSSGINSVRASQFKADPFVTRVTVELDEMMPYQIYYDKNAGDMVIQLEHNTEKAFQYWATSKTASKLAFRSNETTEFDFSVSDFGRTLNVSVYKAYIELPILNLDIDDPLLETINIEESQNGDIYHIEIRLKEDINYQTNSPAGAGTKEFIIEFTTKQNNSIPLIVIDPGHGGTDPGATSPINSLMEKHVVLDISQKLNKLLTDAGFRTYMTRTADNAITLADRAGVANQLQGDLFVSVHANAAASSSANGIENLYYPSENNSNDARDNKKLAQVFQKEMVRMLGAHSRGIVPREQLYVIRETKMPAVLTEVGFLTNPEEAAKLATPEYRQLVAESIYQSILKYFEEIK
ncbi:N-acetylmuramoyl-L-alanine amidase [Anaerovirgula multivorans]|uniref:N-acetylmuramoyl-L-alanine amidase n=1 Tax=Anaerovirgula multivorans TaxID=312168 RepID=A0A239GRM6_9FIRM|nr:N-acetylmuramoyl-L-alanine amidase [Anaerovirgula multivorans]SNS71482.1 N-acetylmuramoyl-L-alanine amidase [Anaerovirgula multivorans]